MNAQTTIREHRSQLIQLRRLADKDLAMLLNAVSSADVAEVRNLLILAFPEIVAPYEAAATELAAVMFEELRAEAGRRGVFYADPARSAANTARVDATVRWAVAPLADETLASTPLSRLSGSVSRIIMDASRQTVQLNGERDSVSFQRMPRPGACAFCQMLASRGSDYRSEDSAGGKVTYSRDGKSWTGTSSHDDCHCVVMPVYPGTAMASLAQAEQKKFDQMYVKASKLSEGGSAQEVLAAWRKAHGTH